MAAFDYTKVRDGAVTRLMDRFGQDVTVKVRTGKTRDLGAGTSTPAYSDKTVRAAILDYKLSEIDGTQVQRGDKRALINPADTSGTAFTMTGHDKVTFDSKEHEVVHVEPVSPAGTTVLYKAQLRGSA